ncbi:rod shape-determining protein RodA [Phocaeicola oris]|uniref:rod shape-determining protein RodA n=1 Tax=Phocaeicola oris TaxID=2896850 RepID=UPI00234E8123|nr:rod shape-determining protein RodA [Phocaeicola oris]MCE2615990.1 rod shape-determining protein RodA [Phocaeicola oris]
MAYTKGNMFKSVDWFTIALYLALVIFGWFSICGASYDYGDIDFFSFDTRSGKQIVWMSCSLGLGFILLMLDDKLYDIFAYLLYGVMILILFVTPFIADNTKGSYSWLKLGSISIQPAEFAKFATALALAKFMSKYNYSMQKVKDIGITLALFLVPMALIVMQRETGSALVYLAFFLMLYREGMPGVFLFAGICAVIFFVVGIRFGDELMPDRITSIGHFSVLAMITALTPILIYVYSFSKQELARNLFFLGIGLTLLALLFSLYVIPFNITYFQLPLIFCLAIYLLFISLRDRLWPLALVCVFAVGSVAFLYSADYVFDKMLEPHQQVRIKVVLGMEDDPAGSGYNVNQSKIAIGSGGLTGKGFLKGTQTKLKYVPEQDTDFIFCTVGEEEGFIGSAAVLLLFTILILRLIYLAERQHTTFGRVYGYAVVSIIFFHLFINIGMVLGLTPVIGIPLPFFSYGGSSLWGFTLLLFIFLRIDAGRSNH